MNVMIYNLFLWENKSRAVIQQCHVAHGDVVGNFFISVNFCFSYVSIHSPKSKGKTKIKLNKKINCSDVHALLLWAIILETP